MSRMNSFVPRPRPFYDTYPPVDDFRSSQLEYTPQPFDSVRNPYPAGSSSYMDWEECIQSTLQFQEHGPDGTQRIPVPEKGHHPIMSGRFIPFFQWSEARQCFLNGVSLRLNAPLCNEDHFVFSEMPTEIHVMVEWPGYASFSTRVLRSIRGNRPEPATYKSLMELVRCTVWRFITVAKDTPCAGPAEWELREIDHNDLAVVCLRETVPNHWLAELRLEKCWDVVACGCRPSYTGSEVFQPYGGSV